MSTRTASQADMFAALEPPPWVIGGVPDDTLPGLVWDLKQLDLLKQRLAGGASSFPSKDHFRQFKVSYEQIRGFHLRSYQGALDELQEVWGRNGRAAFDKEARRLASFPGQAS